MQGKLTEVHWLDQRENLALVELVELSGLSEPELRELVEYGAIAPLDANATPWMFHYGTIAVARTAQRWRKDFELDAPGLSLALNLLDRIHELEAQLRDLHALLSPPRRVE